MMKIFAAKARSFAVVLKKYSARCQRGAILIFFVALLPVLLGFMGLAVDFGLAYSQKGKIQDIADAAALAGAVHISDTDDRDGNIAKQVKNYVEANGLTVNSMVLKNTLAAWDSLETLAAGENCCVAYGVVTVNTDGVDKERLRVRITKRSPSFFLNVLGDFSDGLTVNALAAAEGNSVAAPAPASSGDPVLWANQLQCYNVATSQVIVPPNYDLNMYHGKIGGDINPINALPGPGVSYTNTLSDIFGGSVEYGYDFATHDIYFDPEVANGREYVLVREGNSILTEGTFRNSPAGFSPNNSNSPGYDEWYAKHKELMDLGESKIAEYNEKIKLIDEPFGTETNQWGGTSLGVADKQEYIDGVTNGNNKRFIGPMEVTIKYDWGEQKQTVIVNTIKDDDTEIELCVYGTYNLDGSSNWMQTSRSYLTNHALKNVKKVNKLVVSPSLQYSYIATEGITYGDVYMNSAINTIVGKDNIFGTVYSGNLYVGGNNNSYLGSSGKPAFINSGIIYMGMTDDNPVFSLVEENGATKQKIEVGKGEYKWGSNSEWKIYFGTTPSGTTGSGSSGSGSGSSGSESGSGSASGASTKLRLVE